MKTCIKCLQEQTLDRFAVQTWNKSLRFNVCRDCVNRKAREKWAARPITEKRELRAKSTAERQEMYAFVKGLKEANPCLDCGAFYPCYVMDYDHKHDKSRTIAALIGGGYSKDRILEEIAKCELVCANCHRERTYGPEGNHPTSYKR